MNPLKTFLICLAPALLALMLMLLGNWVGEWVIWFAVVLIVVGAILSGACVAGHLHRSMEPKGQSTPLKVVLGILVILGVALAYFGIASAGCCGLAMATMN